MLQWRATGHEGLKIHAGKKYLCRPLRQRVYTGERSTYMDRQQYENYHEAKAHTLPDFPYNTYLCSIPLDFLSVPTHWHEEVEFVVMKKGAGLIQVDLVPYEVTAGDIVVILPGQLHSIEQKGHLVMEYENILFRVSLLDTGGKDLCSKSFLEPLFRGRIDFPTLIDRSCILYPIFSETIAKIDEICDTRPKGYQLGIKGYLFQILFGLINISQTREHSTNQNSVEKVKLILSFIRENYQRSITIEEIASVCYYSKSHFMKFFKESMGMGFIQYLNDYRLSIASQMLLVTGDSILEIAEKTGFENLSYFNRVFKRKYGVSPGQFRRQQMHPEAESRGNKEQVMEG